MWAEREISILREFYPLEKAKGVKEKLSNEGFNRTAQAIRDKAYSLKIKALPNQRKVIRRSDGYFYQPTKDGYRLYHLWVWEQIYGEIPSGYVLAHRKRKRKIKDFKSIRTLHNSIKRGEFKLMRKGELMNRHRSAYKNSRNMIALWNERHMRTLERLEELLKLIECKRKLRNTYKVIVEQARIWYSESTDQIEKAQREYPKLNEQVQQLVLEYQKLRPNTKNPIFQHLPRVA